jgi:hypothetical protein
VIDEACPVKVALVQLRVALLIAGASGTALVEVSCRP